MTRLVRLLLAGLFLSVPAAAQLRSVGVTPITGGVVTTVNSVSGAVTLAAGTNITITPSGSTFTFAASGGATPTCDANQVVAGPASGAAAEAACRSLVSLDLGSFTLQPSFKNLTVQPLLDTISSVYRRCCSGQVSNIMEFQDEANGLLSAIAPTGNFIGNVDGTADAATALAADPADCSTGQKASGANASGTAQGCTDKVGLAYGGSNADLSATGGTSQVLQQTSSGAAVTVGQLAASNLSNGTSGTGAVALVTDPALVRPAISGTPASAGALGYDSTTGATTQHSGLTGTVASFPRVLAAGTPVQSFINDTAADQDYTALMTLPAGTLIAGKQLRVTLSYQAVTGVSTVTTITYLKLGSTKVLIAGAQNIADSLSKQMIQQFIVAGSAAAGASVNTYSSAGPNWGGATNWNTAQPIALATNGTLAITAGITYSATGSTETHTLMSFIVEELN